MSKFKVLGVFLALVYSFFSYTVTHRDDYSVREGVFSESQIRRLDSKSEDALISVLRSSSEQQSLVEGEPSLGTAPTLAATVFRGKPEGLRIKSEKQQTYRSLAIERYRVLRN